MMIRARLVGAGAVSALLLAMILVPGPVRRRPRIPSQSH
jgi:hypothetical protein